VNIELKKIRLQNFKGAKNLEVKFWKETGIWGDNETGKTTIFDGFLWCLFGKDSQDKSDFEIKPLEVTGAEKHNLETMVEVFMEVDKKPLAVKKVYQEKYTKKRGTATYEFTKHETDRFLDGVPLQKKEFDERIKAIINEDVFRLLTDPRYFNEQLHWSAKRKILMEIRGGDIENGDVLDSMATLQNKGEIGNLTNILNNHSIDDFKKMVASQKVKINEQLKKIPVRIDEASKSIVEIRADIDTVPAQIGVLEAKKTALEKELTDIQNGGNISAKRIELQNVIAEIQKAKNNFEEDRRKRLVPLNDIMAAFVDKKSALSREIVVLDERKGGYVYALGQAEVKLVTFREEWNKIDSEEFNDETICPTCGQELPEEQADDARTRFNQQKAERLLTNGIEGKACKAKIIDIENDIAACAKSIVDFKDKIAKVKDDSELVEDQINAINVEQADVVAAEAKKVSLEEEIEAGAPSADTIIDLKTQIKDANTQSGTLMADLQSVINNKAIPERISELKDEEKDFSKQFEKLEGDLFLVESFVRAKVSLLEGPINEKFSLVKFKLFEDQINGGLSEVCEATLDGVTYPSINNAGKIQAGMDIIKTLQAHYNVCGPIFVDNAESIVRLPKVDCQVIRLIVSEQDKKLRIEGDV